MRFVYDKDACANFAARVLNSDKNWGDWFQCIGLERDGKLCAVAVFNDYTGHNIEITVASDGRWAFRGVIRRALDYAFKELKCRRITAHIRPSNERALSAAKRVGFKDEGRARLWFGNEDAVILGLLSDEVLV
jgi:RimJ/RimL family protein N-acetyltransferase